MPGRGSKNTHASGQANGVSSFIAELAPLELVAAARACASRSAGSRRARPWPLWWQGASPSRRHRRRRRRDGRHLRRPPAASRTSRSSPSNGAATPATRPAASPTSWAARSTDPTASSCARPSSTGPTASTCASATRRSPSTSTPARSRSAPTTPRTTLGYDAPAARHGRRADPAAAAGHRARLRARRADARRRRGPARATPTPTPVPAGRRGRRRLHRPGDGRGLRAARAAGRRSLEQGAAGDGARSIPTWARSWTAAAASPRRRRPPRDARSTGFEPGAVITADGALDADLVVLGIGVRPNSRAGRRGRPRARAPRTRCGSTVASAPRPTASGRRATAARAATSCSGEARPHRPRHRGQQAVPRGRHQHRRWLRHLPRRGRARPSPRSATPRCPAPACRSREAERAGFRRSRSPSKAPPGPGYFPGRRADDAAPHRGARQRPAARCPDRGRRAAPPCGSTPAPWPSPPG